MSRRNPVSTRRPIGALALAGGCLLLLLSGGCGGAKKPESLSPGNRSRIELWAGKLAVCLSSDPPGRPDSSEMEAFIEFCEERPARYVYLYACLKDSLAKQPQPPPSCQEEQPPESLPDSAPAPAVSDEDSQGRI
ncbi:hypothetical protein GF402_06260 [Candidatus Fermentibacteria bacterium]|nr:hypothetical protein [Candidatus Fermentibacteria bacterium]